MKQNRVKELLNGYDRTGEINTDTLKNSKLELTHNSEHIKGINIFITVPTPIDEEKKPDLTAIFEASKFVGKIIPGSIVVYEVCLSWGYRR